MITDANGCTSTCTTTAIVQNCTCTPVNVCLGDDITTSVSGYTTDAGYALVFLLTDGAGIVQATSGDQVLTGTYDFATNGLSAGTTYNVYALSYDTNNAPDALPINVGDNVNDIGNNMAGCYNADFLYDYQCYTIENCCTANISDITDQQICEGTDPDLLYTISPYGGIFGPEPTPITDYSYAFFLTDASGNILQIDGISPIPGSSTSHTPDFDYSVLSAASSPYNVYFVIYNSAGGVTLVDEANADAAVIVGTNIFDLGTSDNSDCLEADFSTLEVNENPILIDQNPAVCADVTAVDLTALEASIGIVGGTWYLADNTTLVASPTAADPTTSPFSYIYSDGNMCADTAMVTYTINPLPIVATAAMTLCEDTPGSGMATFDLTSMNATVDVAGTNTVTWYVDAAYASEILTPTAYVSNNATVYAQVSDGTCMNSTTATLTVTPYPMADSPANVVACGSYTLPALTNGMYYDASGGPAGGSVVAANTVITANTTLYVYAESGTTPNCVTENSFTITINNQYVATPGASLTLCEDVAGGGTATFDLTQMDAMVGGGDPVTWYADAGYLSTILSPTTYESASGIVYAIVGAGSACPDSTMATLTVEPQPTVNAGTDFAICAGDVANLSGSIGGGASSATWSIVSGTGSFDNVNALNAIYTPSAADSLSGSVTLQLTTDDPAGDCVAASDQVTITINPIATVYAGTDQTICYGSAPITFADATIGGSATTAYWQIIATTGTATGMLSTTAPVADPTAVTLVLPAFGTILYNSLPMTQQDLVQQ
ncbi:MAG: hypothetical protein R2798_06875 [Chitinophagales bacterium]